MAHSTNIVKAKIPLGHYFGFPFIFKSEQPEKQQSSSVTNSDDTVIEAYSNGNGVDVEESHAKNTPLLLGYLGYLEKLYQDKKCHYFMSLGKLRELLNEINYPGDNIGHLKMMQFNADNNDAATKIKEVYAECLDNQFQFNLNAQLVKKLRLSLGLDEATSWMHRSSPRFDAIPTVNLDLEKQVDEMSQDKLRVCNGLLIKTLLCLTWKMSNERQLKFAVDASPVPVPQFTSRLSLQDACDLFSNLCVHGNHNYIYTCACAHRKSPFLVSSIFIDFRVRKST